MIRVEGCPKPLPAAWNVVGFSDDTNFYVLNNSKVLSFPKDVIGSNLDKPVPYTLSPMSDVIVPPASSGGGENGRSGTSGKL